MSNRSWNLLCWNIRGINAVEKCDAIWDKIEESACTVICLQETKHEHFDMSYICKFEPRRFDQFDYIPSIGASGRLLLAWNSSIFGGVVMDKQSFGITVKFTLAHNVEVWFLTNVYGPCDDPARTAFINWFKGHKIHDTCNWIFLGDSNFYRSLNNRNRPGGNLADTLVFNDAIGHLGLIELPLKGRAYTWSNMQLDPLLEQLDWFFTSTNWTLDYPNTEVLPLAKITSDHIPCKVAISTRIPRSNIFCFENFWAEHDCFLTMVQESWLSSTGRTDSTRLISSKFKLKADLRKWSRNLSNLKLLIENCSTIIGFLDALEDVRLLYNLEANLRRMIKMQLQRLLHYKNIYWKKRYTVNRIKLGDECTKFFHGMATTSYRRNSISQILNDQGVWVHGHEGKARLLWSSFRNRMGVSTNPTMFFNQDNLIDLVDGLVNLAEPFQQMEIDHIVRRMPSDKAPGPDGFNGLFMKKYWHIIKPYFYKFCNDFIWG